MNDEQQARYISALLNELHGYEQNGKEERAESVRAELRRVGHEAKAPAKRAETRAEPAKEKRA